MPPKSEVDKEKNSTKGSRTITPPKADLGGPGWCLPDASTVRTDWEKVGSIAPDPTTDNVKRITTWVTDKVSSSAKKSVSVKVDGPLASKGKKLTEADASVPFDGSIGFSVGRGRPKIFETVSVADVVRIAEGYASVGQRCEITLRADRPSVTNLSLMNEMMNVAHYRHHRMDALAEAAEVKAFSAFKASVASEFTPVLYETKAEWSERAARPSFRLLAERAAGMYRSRLRPFEVDVRATTGRGNELVTVMSSALNETLAASSAIDQAIVECGLGTKVRNATVNGKVFLPEDCEAGLGKVIKFFPDLPSSDGIGIAKGSSGDKAAAKPSIRKDEKSGAPQGKGFDKMPRPKKGGKVSSPGTKLGTAVAAPMPKSAPVAKDKGAVFVTESDDADFMAYLTKIVGRLENRELKQMVEDIQRKIEGGEILTHQESIGLDKIIAGFREEFGRDPEVTKVPA